jgi:hypothetical protein
MTAARLVLKLYDAASGAVPRRVPCSTSSRCILTADAQSKMPVGPGSSRSATGAHEVGHTLGVSHEHGGLMSAVNATSGINGKHVGEILGRMGIGNTKLGGEGAGRGRVNGVVGTGFFGFNTGKVMTGRQYERMSKK